LVLVLGDFFVQTRAQDVPEKLKELLGPNKVHHVVCLGNIGSKTTLDWLKTLSPEFHAVKGDDDEIGEFPENKVINVGRFRIGAIHGHQVVPWGDEEALLNFARDLDCDILLSGHTHQSKVSTLGGRHFVNPGSITGAYSALSMDNNPSFAVLEVVDDTVNVYIYEWKGGKVQINKAVLKEIAAEKSS